MGLKSFLVMDNIKESANNLFNLKDKVAVVTGGGGVLGGRMAVSLARMGVKVAIINRTQSKGQKIADEASKFSETIAYEGNVLNKEALQVINEDILKNWGKVDILINAAGGNMPGATIGPDQNFYDLSLDDTDSVLNLNLKGTILPTLIFSKSMSERKSGSIINISSMATYSAVTRVLGYSMAKSGVNIFTKWLAVEMANKYGSGIRVNAIAPGFFLTEQNRDLLTKKDGSYTERAKSIINATPFKRFGDPDELNSTLQWLCADSSAFITGIVVPVDGGFSAFSGV